MVNPSSGQLPVNLTRRCPLIRYFLLPHSGSVTWLAETDYNCGLHSKLEATKQLIKAVWWRCGLSGPRGYIGTPNPPPPSCCSDNAEWATLAAKGHEVRSNLAKKTKAFATQQGRQANADGGVMEKDLGMQGKLPNSRACRRSAADCHFMSQISSTAVSQILFLLLHASFLTEK